MLHFNLILACAALLQAPQGTTYAIRAKRLFTGDGKTIENGIIIVSGEKISAVGKDIPIPSGATEVEAEAVTPGLIDANALAGVRDDNIEDSSEITPSFRMVDQIDFAAPSFERLPSRGVTTGFFAPGNRAVVGGLAAIVKSAPKGAPHIVQAEAALKAAFGSEPAAGNFTPRGFGLPQNFHVRRPGSRPGTVMELRMALLNAKKSVGKLGIVPPDQLPLVNVFEKNTPVRLFANDLVELRSAMRVIREFELKNVTIDGAGEAYRCAEEIKNLGIRIVLHPHARDPILGVRGDGRRIDYEDTAPAQDSLARLAAAGIPVAQSAFGAAVEDDLAAQMRYAVRYGASPETALAAVTAGAAGILNISDRTGTIGAGKDADLVLWGGDPFEWTSAVKIVFVDGRIAHGRVPARKQ
jgi:imidazolonepropionase-like amidohydrolase